MAWKAWSGKKSVLTVKPALSQGLATHLEDRDLEMGFTNLQKMEENSKKLYKGVQEFEDYVETMHKLEQKIASELSNSPVCQENDGLKKICEDYQSVVYQMGNITDDLIQLSQRTVEDPMKKLMDEFPSIAAALKRRDSALQECLKLQLKYEKLTKQEKTGANIVKTEAAKKAFQAAKAEFESQNRVLLLDLPQFYEKRIDYFQPCLQALIRTQLDYFGESTKLFTYLVSANPDAQTLVSDDEHQERLQNMMGELKTLSIVGN